MIAGDCGRTAQDQLQRQEDKKYEYNFMYSRFMHTLMIKIHTVNNDAIKLTADLLHLFITGTRTLILLHMCVSCHNLPVCEDLVDLYTCIPATSIVLAGHYRY